MPDPSNKVKRTKATTTTKPKKKPNWQKQIDELGGSASIWNDDSAKGVSNEEIRKYYLASGKKKRGGTIKKDSWSNRANQRD